MHERAPDGDETPVIVHDHVIVGAGLAGAATAWHLAHLGAEDVVILEREALPGVHSSGRNAALLRESSDTPAWQPLNREGAGFLREASLASFRRTGSLLIGRGDEPASAHIPFARGAGLFCPDDGIVDVAALLGGYLAGRDVRWSTPLLSWHDDDGFLRLVTDAGEVGARVLVNAAGAWAGGIGSLPLRPTNRHLFVSEPAPGIDPDWPFVWHVDEGLYFRPESGGWLLCPCDETDAAPGDYREDPEALETLAERASRLQPGLGDLAIRFRWVGQRTFASDRAPVVGFDPRQPRLFHVAGLGGHGMTASFALGRLAAEAILGRGGGARPLDPARILDQHAR